MVLGVLADSKKKSKGLSKITSSVTNFQIDPVPLDSEQIDTTEDKSRFKLKTEVSEENFK